jgi:hypothetical protein
VGAKIGAMEFKRLVHVYIQVSRADDKIKANCMLACDMFPSLPMTTALVAHHF